ncbi:MAG: hypothetical protein ACLRFK_02955 [Alphaproteobacteria bacterium]
MASQTINISRKKYAVGLFWQPEKVGVSARVYAHSLANGIDKKANLYTEYRSMIGLGSTKVGHRMGMRVAAADVMDAFSEYTSFLAVFSAGKQFYLVASRNGIILQDKLFNSEDDARTEYVKLSEIPDWGAFFAPGSWGMPRAVEKDLEDVLGVHNGVRLHQISYLRSGMLSAGLIALFVILFGAVFFDSIKTAVSPRPNVNELDPELVAEYKRQIEEKNKELDQQFEIKKQLPPEPIVMPYEVLPDVQFRAVLCYNAIAFLMQPISGWNQTFAECNESHAIVEFKRSFGTLDEFYNVATNLMPGAFVQEINSDTLRVQAKLPEIPTVSSQDERDVQTVVRDVTSAFQAIDTDIETQIVFDTITNGVDTVNVNIVEVQTQSKLTPDQFMRVFDDFGGVYLINCAWDAASRIWNYEVIIYAK